MLGSSLEPWVCWSQEFNSQGLCMENLGEKVAAVPGDNACF